MPTIKAAEQLENTSKELRESVDEMPIRRISLQFPDRLITITPMAKEFKKAYAVIANSLADLLVSEAEVIRQNPEPEPPEPEPVKQAQPVHDVQPVLAITTQQNENVS